MSGLDVFVIMGVAWVAFLTGVVVGIAIHSSAESRIREADARRLAQSQRRSE